MSTPALTIHQPEAADATSLSDQAYYRIRELIVTLELAPGSLVSERELMERLASGGHPCARRFERSRASASSRSIRGAECSSRASTCAISRGSPRCV